MGAAFVSRRKPLNETREQRRGESEQPGLFSAPFACAGEITLGILRESRGELSHREHKERRKNQNPLHWLFSLCALCVLCGSLVRVLNRGGCPRKHKEHRENQSVLDRAFFQFLLWVLCGSSNFGPGAQPRKTWPQRTQRTQRKREDVGVAVLPIPSSCSLRSWWLSLLHYPLSFLTTPCLK